MNNQDAEKFFEFLNHQKWTELRVIDPNDGLKRQIFVDNLEDFLATCQKFDGKINIYVGVNERDSKGGKAENVRKASIIPLDIDPVRPKGEASTNEELELARQKMEEIKSWLKKEFGCSPFAVMSGNGYHLHLKLPPINLDEFNRDVVQEKVKSFVHKIQDMFKDEHVHIDSTFDLPRVMECPGTLSVKGHNTPERPWRTCKIIMANDEPCVELREHLAEIKAAQPTTTEFQFGTKTKQDFNTLLQEDAKLRDLFEGHWEKYKFPTRSEAEQSLLTKLVLYGFSEVAIHEIMSQSEIGKWREKGEAYRLMSMQKAIEFVEEYRSKTKRGKMQKSCGEVLSDMIFEQTDDGFIIFDKETGKITKRKTVDTFKPFERLTWNPVSEAVQYESERQLWQEIREYIYEHVDLPEGYDVLAAWVLASWTPERWHAVPYLFFYGPAGSGKTWALEVLASIGFRPAMSASATLAAIFRLIDTWHPTLYLDETEAYMRKERSEVLHLLNAGYRKDFPAWRVEDTKDGFLVKFYDCFGFKALAGTREFIQTLKSRCIIFNMSKATRKIKTIIDRETGKKLQRKLLMYRFKMLAKEEEVEPPGILTGRLRELFDPLIIVAPAEAKQSIINKARKIKAMIAEEERTSDEALVFNAVYDIHEATHQRKITIEEITNLVNENMPAFEQINNSSVGWTLSRLGFKKTIYKGKRAIYWNKELAQRLKRRYLRPEEPSILQKLSEEGNMKSNMD